MRLAVARALFVLAGVSAAAAIAPHVARAQPMPRPPPSGSYEAWSQVRMGPVGRLAAAPATQGPLARWLDVTTQGSSATIRFQPEGRVVWRTTWGPAGLVEKRVEVDGEPWARSVFERDARGCVVRKTVTGRVTRRYVGGPETPWPFSYRCDAQARPVERTGTIVLRHPWGSRALVPPTAPERVTIRWTAAGGSEVRTFVAGSEVRRDVFDADGLVLRTHLGAPSATRSRIALVYLRDRAGHLLSIERIVRGHRSSASSSAPLAGITPAHIAALAHAPVERHEIELALGAPVRTSDEGRGVERRVTLDYSPTCWLNELSSVELDPAGLLVSGVQGCICGVCVDAALATSVQSDVLAVDTHWTAGPWVRLNGSVDVTDDHEIMTPSGPRAAGALRAGEIVLADDGSARALVSVERLPAGPPRLGRNVRTRDGTFAAGGILFRSEQPRACPMPVR